MPNWESRFREFIAGWMREEENLSVKLVTSIEETTKRRGGWCNTCGYDETVLIVNWIDFDEEYQRTEFTTSFANLFGVR